MADLDALRRLVDEAVMGLDGTHRELEALCPRLGLPALPAEGTKRERLTQCLLDLAQADLSQVAAALLREKVLSAPMRVAVEDAVWASASGVEVPARVRREIARGLDIDDLVYRADRFEALLDRLWVLDTGLLAAWAMNNSNSLRGRITQHVFTFRDWSTEELFDALGAFEAGDARFARFLEGIVSPAAVPDEPRQRLLVEAVNTHLRSVGAELRESGIDGGYPVFAVVPTRLAHARRPKNLIFATPNKPDIRFSDLVDGDIEILGDSDAYLAYDRPIRHDGILWRDLQAWWKDTRGLPDDGDAKKDLYARLLKGLPQDSPPQRYFYEAYHQIHGSQVYDLPALLPEVWLLWDPKTVKARGPQALLGHRMDFLLLLPHGQRVVLEVDGEHHYATDGLPDKAKYAAQMRSDRILKLRGYEVFRFGALDLTSAQRARAVLEPFFQELFALYEVTPRPV